MERLLNSRLILLGIMLPFVTYINAQQTVTLANGTKIPVKFSIQVSSEDKVEPQVVVASDIVDYDGNLLITEGSFVKVYWNKTSTEYNGNNGGKITINFSYTQAVDGKNIYLSGGYEVNGKSNLAGNFVTMNGKKLKGKPAIIQAGTVYDGVITKQAFDIKITQKNNVPTVNNNNVSINSSLSYFSISNISKYQNKNLLAFQRTLLLKPDNSFYLWCDAGNGGVERKVSGTYSIIGKSLMFTPSTCYEDDKKQDCFLFMGGAFSAQLITDETDLYYSEYVKVTFPNQVQDECFSTRMFGVPGTEPINVKRTHNGIDVIAVGQKTATTLKATNMRETPNINGKLVPWDIEFDESTSIPAGYEILTLARSLEKAKIGNWEDYWYLVEVKSWDGFGEALVWVYGQNIKI